MFNKRENVIIFWLAFFSSVGVAWGVVNGFLLYFGIFVRECSNDFPLFFYVLGEFAMWAIGCCVLGAAIGIINCIFKESNISLKSCFMRISAWWNGDVYYAELHKALKMLDIAIEKRSEKEIIYCVGQAKECLVRALGD